MSGTELAIKPSVVMRNFLDEKCQKVLIVANDRRIGVGAFSGQGFSEDDVIVQFNKAPLFDTLKPYNCHKVHIFNANSYGAWWGFSKEGVPDQDYTDQAASGVTLIYNRWMSDKIKAYLAGAAPSVQGFALDVERNIPSYTYPEGKLPSVGYVGVIYFRYMNLLRFLMKRRRLEITLVGFTGSYPPGQAWPGHDFAYEQRCYDVWLDLVRLDHEGRNIQP